MKTRTVKIFIVMASIVFVILLDLFLIFQAAGFLLIAPLYTGENARITGSRFTIYSITLIVAVVLEIIGFFYARKKLNSFHRILPDQVPEE